MFTDAIMRCWGAVWNYQGPASGFFDAAKEGYRINELYILAAIHGLRAFARFVRSLELVRISDSLLIFHIVRNWTSRAPCLISHSTESARAMRVL
jgi:hypothetical protein